MTNETVPLLGQLITQAIEEQDAESERCRPKRPQVRTDLPQRDGVFLHELLDGVTQLNKAEEHVVGYHNQIVELFGVEHAGRKDSCRHYATETVFRVSDLNIACIYQITFDGCKDFYIGQTSQFLLRMAQHLDGLRKGRHHNHRMQIAFNRLGEASMRIGVIEACPNADKSHLLERERFWMCSLRPGMS